jgi:hypothetical protein
VYVGANRKLPEKRDERFGLILLYDDHQANGLHQAALAIPGGIELSAEDLKQRLERQGK